VTNDYTISKKNRIRQLAEYAHYDRATVHRILDAGLVAQVGLIENAAAIVVPMIYGREDQTLFLHGARKARIIKLLAAHQDACVNVTLLDGLVLARSAFNSSMRYRSATVFGKPRLIESSSEKLHAMRIISEHSMPGRWDELREPWPRELKMTGVIRLDIEHASAKESASLPDDEEDDYDAPVWAGALTMTTTFEALVDDDRLQPTVEPSVAVRSLLGRKL